MKLVLLLRCHADPAFAPTFLKVSKPITRLIIAGMILLALSGIGWLLLGYGFTSRLIVKLVLFAAIWVLGPVISTMSSSPGSRRRRQDRGNPPRRRSSAP